MGYLDILRVVGGRNVAKCMAGVAGKITVLGPEARRLCGAAAAMRKWSDM